MPYSLVGAAGLERTYDLAKDVVERGIERGFVECGVARGGCAALVATVAAREGKKRHCWFFDSYEGLPNPTKEDFDGAQEQTGAHIRPLGRRACLGTYADVQETLFSIFELAEEHVTMTKGWFQKTLPKERNRIGPIALLRLDGDWYDSTKCCLENLFHQVCTGGHIIIDDYYSCYGARKATDEFLSTHGIDVMLVPDGRGGCSFSKPGPCCGV